MSQDIKVSHSTLRQFCSQVLTGIGVPEVDAEIVADTMVKADLRGVNSHGVARLPSYVRRVRAGLMSPNTQVTVVRETQSTLLIDGGNGFGQVAAYWTVRKLIQKARSSGVAAGGIRNTNHYGMGAYYAVMPTEHDMIGLAVSNAPPAMAPIGGSKAMLGTNPLSVAAPCGKWPAVVLDMATSLVSRGKIRLAAIEGKKIPPGWGLDSRGVPTDDPHAVLRGGTLTPIAGPKGYGLAFMIDVLAGVLTGAGFGEKLKAIDDLSGEAGTGNFFMVIDIGSFMPVDEFKDRIDALVEQIKNSPRVPGVEKIYLPGEIEWENEQLRLKEGISLPEEVVRELMLVGQEVGCRLEVA
ncbi:MAG: Ldh family oxidoreductase [Bacillota bacterium]